MLAYPSFGAGNNRHCYYVWGISTNRERRDRDSVALGIIFILGKDGDCTPTGYLVWASAFLQGLVAWVFLLPFHRLRILTSILVECFQSVQS